MGKDWLFGKPNIFLLFLFFLPGNTSPTTEPQYMVLLPFLIHTDAPEKACVQLTHLNESVTLSTTLEYQGENRSLIDDVVSEKDIFTCIPFSLPKSNSTSVAFLTVMVKGETQQFRSRKSVLVKNSESLVFVQTDKPIYKPGQTVLFRIVSLDKDFHPLNEKFPLVYIQDPQRNRIYQWQGVELETGLIELSFPLTSDPMQGSYKIVVQKSVTSHVEHSFSVEEYVLPKYEVLVKLPKMITIEDKELPVSVCGLYTYGKPVPGLVNVQVCRKFSNSGSHCYGKDSEAVCEEFVRRADARGCVSDVVRTKIFQLQRSGYKMSIEVQGKITEDGTGIEMVGTGSCEITSIMSKVSFHLLDSYYRPGIPLFGMVKLVDEVRVHYVFTPDVIGEQRKIVIYYLVMAKGSIMLADTHDLTVNPGDAYGIFQLTFPVEATIAPKAQMLVYTTLPSGEVIASSADFQVESCLPNKVSLSFIPKEGLPASNTRLQLHSSPKSLCAIRAVDKSVLLMKPEDELSHKSLYDLLPEEMKEIQGYSFKDYYLEDDDVNPCLTLDNILLNGFVYVPISPDGKGDAYDILKLLGLKVFTSSKIHKPEICQRYRVEFSVSAEALQNQQPCGNAIVETPEKGRKDTVIRQLLVEPEGMEVETTYNSVICASEKSMSETVALVLPENVVDGSARAYFSVLGDIMGTSMQNLHQLLQMPFGCGEQNMVLFAPNIYVLDYLNKTGQLSEEIKSKAIGYLVSGYQRQLNYKHWDGSYSTFGPQFGQAGNTWLTAFVLKSFAQARPYIFIYEKHIQDALIWLTQKQKENGCFHSSGTLLNNAMKGGVDNEVSLTAYITIALLEIPLPVTHSVVRNALFCLETAANAEENHVYTKALLAYAFALAGMEEKRKAMLGLLEKEAVKKDEFATQEYSAPCTTEEVDQGNV
ncbi:Alpha-2-macroglobulin-like protein [Aix galericulata]|nr:Alpha-2-macroglobulin-like protein [Aix galericulata]